MSNEDLSNSERSNEVRTEAPQEIVSFHDNHAIVEDSNAVDQEPLKSGLLEVENNNEQNEQTAQNEIERDEETTLPVYQSLMEPIITQILNNIVSIEHNFFLYFCIFSVFKTDGA